MTISDKKARLFKRYSLRCFDESLTLKIPLNMWLIIIYGLYPFPASLLGYVPRGGKDMAFLQEHIGLFSLLGSFATVLFVIAFFKRSTEASTFWRNCWRHGAILLGVPTIGFVVDAVSGSYQGSWESVLGESSVIYLAIASLLCFYMLFFVPRLKDTFLDYPEEESEEGK
jgi:hypothetical protein